MRWWWSLTLGGLGLVSAGPSSNFKQKLAGKVATHNQLFHDALLQQLADSRSSTQPAMPEPTLDNLIAVTPTTNAVVAAAAIGIQPVHKISGTIFGDSDLNNLCTATCTSSLASYRANVVTACKGYSMILDPSTNVSYAPTLAVDYVLGPYTIQCLKDSTSGSYCLDVLKGFNASAGISSLPMAELCSNCVFGTMNVTLLSPVLYSMATENLYDVSAATCGLPKFNPSLITSPIVSPGTPSGSNSTSTVSAQCAMLGRNVTVSTASTCAAVAKQFSVSLYDVSSSNSLPQTTCNVPAGSPLCLPQACTTYTVATNDTCASIAAAANITTVQLGLYNVNFGSACQYLPQLVGNLVCVSPHGGFPSVAASSAAIAPSGTATMLAPVPTPTAVGSTAACGEWAIVVEGDFCSTFALRYATTVADLFIMNPEINSTCGNLLAGFYYCVEPFPPFSTVTTTALPTSATNFTSISTFSFSLPAPTPTLGFETLTPVGVPAPTNVAPGTRTAACGYYYNISTGDTLASIANISDQAETDLITWNSELSAGVPAVGLAVCVIFPTGNYTLFPADPPENVSPFATADCADYYTTVPNDSCTSIAAAQDISIDQFLALNPGLTCAGLLAGVAYCDFPLTPVPIGPPSNLATGSLANCTTYYTVASGDNCNVVEQKFDTALVDLLRWNTALTASCTTIGLGEAYCVVGGGNPCPQVYTVVPNDSCGAIETKFSITLNDIIAWNPFLTSSCAIQVGQNLCVAGPPSTGAPPTSGPPANIASGSLKNCTTYYTIASGDTCTAVDQKFDIALRDLLEWNTALTSGCTTIQLGSAYCVAGGGDVCSKVYTIASGDSCGSIETKFGITINDITAWNPWLTSTCAIQIGQNLCVSGAPATSTPPASGPPANIATGTLKNCTTYYTIASGDTCTAVDTKFDIALRDLLEWNTALTAACTTIQLGTAYCVAGGGGTCSKIYTVVPNDSCGAIETKFGITMAQMLQWNPFLTSTCAIQVGQNLCVAG
ncbi:hypothetical protein FB45DRAFT_907241 [Roridomyces roridus]|uniref:LysM domain-containing protein n=1 Tax=Roridomyces roridus TaxID=1738132 RepID=A0AAD7C224_9AGAR|nr:hypothetical protein FB45DRAFT_907241 [Roridomyces roridus]